jgi:hypothetical protein
MTKKIMLISLIPIGIILNLFIYSSIVELVRSKSDMSVLVGILLLCVGIFLNLILIKKITQIKK